METDREVEGKDKDKSLGESTFLDKNTRKDRWEGIAQIPMKGRKIYDKEKAVGKKTRARGASWCRRNRSCFADATDPIHAAYILDPFCIPLWASLGLKLKYTPHRPSPIAGLSVVIINPLVRIVPQQTQQNPILQTNGSYMPVQDTFFKSVLSLRAEIESPVR